jgi:histidinol dehydrogenase
MIRRITTDSTQQKKFLASLATRSGEVSRQVNEQVAQIIDSVRQQGTSGKGNTLRFDGSCAKF